MSRRLPPLAALEAFEVAARHLSFRRAGEELDVTPSAVSHRIAGLERDIGVPLFRRRPRQIALTPAGRKLAATLSQALDSIGDAVAAVRPRAAGVLTLSTAPTFAMRWLLPRLPRFRARHPDIDVRVTVDTRVVDFRREDIDAGIRFGKGDWPGLTARVVFGEDITPVCSPKLLESGPRLETPADLRHHTLLHNGLRPDDWRFWLTGAGVRDVDPEAGPRFETLSMALQAASDGLGLAVSEPTLVADELASGGLVAPFDLVLSAASAHYLVYAPPMADDPRIRAFEAWLFEELGGGP